MRISEKQQTKSVKSPEEAVEAVNNMDKVIKGNKCNILWLANQKRKIFEKFKMNDNLINMVNEFKISKSVIQFKISIVKLINKFPIMEKSLLSQYFLKNNFKII